MKSKHSPLRINLSVLILSLLFLTILTTGCGKSEIKRNYNAGESSDTEEFCTAFFTQSNLPFSRLSTSDVQNTPSEYLFYIKGGIVYRTLNDYEIVITARKNINESDEKKGKFYSGELYRIFEDDEIDLLRISAAGNYAILASPSSIPDWENNQIILLFVEFAEHYQREN